jgi:hypothetical protein
MRKPDAAKDATLSAPDMVMLESLTNHQARLPP